MISPVRSHFGLLALFIIIFGVMTSGCGWVNKMVEKGSEMERESKLREPATLTYVEVSFSTDGSRRRSFQKTQETVIPFCLVITNKKSRYEIKKPMFRLVGTTRWLDATIGMNYSLKSRMKVPDGQYGTHMFEAKVEVWDINSNTFIEDITCMFEYKLLRPGQKW